MNRYLLDTNHLSAYLDRRTALPDRIETGLRAGDRFGISLAVHCEYSAGIRLSKRFAKNLTRFQTALGMLRIWPTDEHTAAEFAEIYFELRSQGRMLSQFDMLIAAVARQYRLTLLTADADFSSVQRIHIENWI